ncbi:MAG: hypothetical protein WEB59_15245 [Thermoanaerobaculia bacterium]
MRRFAGFALAGLFLAPAGLRLAAAGSGPDAAAILCAIACGHDATPGAVCCPMRPERSTNPSFSSCSGSGPAGLVSAPAPQPGLVPGRLALAEPTRGAHSEIAGADAPRIFPLPPPDHVPRLLS